MNKPLWHVTGQRRQRETNVSMMKNAYDDEACWRAVEQRADTADGDFVFAVKTTGIYCRPSCASRRPKRENVCFFDTHIAAETAGFRACKRCRPNQASNRRQDQEMVKGICARIDRHFADGAEGPPSLEMIAAEFGLSVSRLQRLFKKILGLSAGKYADELRLQHLKNLLKSGDDVSQAVYGAGYGAISRVYERAGAQLGMTPATYAKGGKGAEMYYAFAQCDLGQVIVGATETGVSFIAFGDDREKLIAELWAEYPAADFQEDPEILQDWLQAVVKQLENPTQSADAVPLDVQATAWQRRVWEQLIRIPTGQTATYSSIAETLGNRKSQRAVARACATNPVSLLIPCHRVLREDGGLGGYRWGLKRKERLLAREATAA